MKKSIIKKIILIPLVSLILSSCDSYLQLEPQDNLIQQEFWQNKEQVESAVAGCYASMNQSAFTERLLVWGELRAEMMVSANASGNAVNMMRNFIVPTNSLVNWNSFYATINYCNLVLDFADGAQERDLSFTEEELNRLKSEVLTIRSLAYFVLVRNFKEVPLVLKGTSSTEVDFYPAKNTEEEIITQIITDLTGAVEHLNLGFTQSAAHDKGKITKGAALALLADVYLWNNQYDECISVCNDLIGLGKYSLVDGADWFNSIFFEGNSDEGIFELQFSDIFVTLRNSFYIGDADYAPYNEIRELFSGFPNDVRANLGTYTFSPTSSLVWKYAGVDETGVYRGQQEFFNTWIFYRYAEVLLMQAEAYILSSTNKDLNQAYNLIDQVHQRATSLELEVDNIDEVSLLDALLLERQKELAFEGKRWYDLLRFARRNNFENQQLILDLVDTKAGADDFEQILSYYSDTESYFLPIAQNEINLNRNLVQNPYYQN